MSADSLARLITAAQGGLADAQHVLAGLYHLGAGVVRNDSLAAEWARKAAGQNHAGAQALLGLLYHTGEGVPKDLTQAAKWYRLAAVGGDKFAQFALGSFIYSGANAVRNSKMQEEAARWIRASAEQGYPAAEFCLGSMYREGDGVAKDSAEAVRWLTAGARHHSNQAQNMLAAMYRSQEWKPERRDEAEKWFREAAEGGGPASQFSLALMLSNSTPLFHGVFGIASGVPDTTDLMNAYMWLRIAEEAGDEEAGKLKWLLEEKLSVKDLNEARSRALDWLEGHPDFPPGREAAKRTEDESTSIADLKRRAESGDAEAQFRLAASYHEGYGVPRNYREAARWGIRAADQGLASAEAGVGDLYLRGEGVAQSSTEAVAWYRKAAEHGSPEGQEQLGTRYSLGEGVPQDDRQALDWTLKSAEQGLASGQYSAGFLLCCKFPSTVPNDEVAAYGWFTLAAEGGYEKAREFLAMLEGTMKAKDLVAGKRNAASWKERHRKTGN